MMRWDGPIQTDSGGFQIFSLGELNVVTEHAATFRNHIDGFDRGTKRLSGRLRFKRHLAATWRWCSIMLVACPIRRKSSWMRCSAAFAGQSAV